ncbi:MAG: alpha/beta fold hydrolase [Akkermansiaceae bacterium]
MREETLRKKIGRHSLHRLIIHPAEGVETTAEAIFYHGQGDYAERYLDILHPFVDRGIRCTITELPGHGYSPGVRGHGGDVSLLDAVTHSTLDDIKARGDLPYGVMGHSMGGLLAARHLVLAGQGVFPNPSFAWLSSPLVDPGMGRHPFFLKTARILAPVLPGLTFSTQVKPENFKRLMDDEIVPAGAVYEKPSCITRSELWHNRVSLGWGISLLDFAHLLRSRLPDICSEIPLLCTQGTQDMVCPAPLTRDLFERLPNRNKRYEEIEQLRHEPFSGEGSERLFKALEEWLESPGMPVSMQEKAPA